MQQSVFFLGDLSSEAFRGRRIVLGGAIYDILATTPLMTPWSARLVLGQLGAAHGELGLGGAPHISELARQAQVKISTVRFYERRGLLSAPRNASGYRVYDEEAARRLRFIRRASELGFELREIEMVLSASADGFIPDEAARALARQKMKQIELQIEDLRRVQQGLESLLRRRKKAAHCPLLDALAP